MQENPESQEKKVTKGYFFEVPGVPKANLKRNHVRDLREKTKRKSAEVLHPWKEKSRKKANSNLKGNLKLAIPRNPGQNLKEIWKKKKNKETPDPKRK